jgi:PAS domain-containing protein
MTKINKALQSSWETLMSPADECGLFPIVARIVVYGFLLFGILFIQGGKFTANELLVVVTFVSIATIVESLWKKSGAGKKIIWHFISLILLVCFLGLLLNEATMVREAWYRTHVLESRITTLLETSPNPVIVADGLGKIKYVNPDATKLTGWTNDEVVGKSLAILMRPNKYPRHKAAFDREAKNLKVGAAKWIYTGNRIFRVVCKNDDLTKAKIYVVGIRYAVPVDSAQYSPGQDIEFYAILQPIETPLEDDES